MFRFRWRRAASGGLGDATDAAQLAELATLGQLTERARGDTAAKSWSKVQVTFRSDQIEVQHEAPKAALSRRAVLVLGPIDRCVSWLRPHQTASATAAAYHGAAMLCYAPKEHVGLPKKDDVKQGCVLHKNCCARRRWALWDSGYARLG